MVMLDAISSVVDNDSFFVITVHHNLRGDEGKRDRDFVAQYCREMGVVCEIYEEDIPSFCAENGYTVEQGARIRRRQIFADTVKTGKAQRVVTAHHLSDNVESILMHVFRGSGLKGLCGMNIDDGILLRPMLDCAREDIDAYIEEMDIPFVEDSTNESVDYTRNRLRREIIPLIKKSLRRAGWQRRKTFAKSGRNSFFFGRVLQRLRFGRRGSAYTYSSVR